MPNYIDTSNIASGKQIVAANVREPLEILDAKVHEIENWPKASSTAGPTDAGKIVTLNGSGIIDGSMIPGVDWNAWQASQRDYNLAFGNPHIHKGYGNEFGLLDYSGMQLYLMSGAAMVDGVPFVKQSGTILTFDPADATYSRIDAIVLRRNVDYTVAPLILKGTPAASPQPPTHQSTDELLWWVTITAGSQSVSVGNAVDQRTIYDPSDVLDAAFIPGEIKLYAGAFLPAGWMWCDGRLVDVKSSVALFQAFGGAFGLGTPKSLLAYVNDNIYSASHGLVVGDAIYILTTGTMPGGLTSGAVYYVREVIDVNHFNLSTTPGGQKVDITSEGSGTHSFYTQFRIPDLRGRFPLGLDNMGGTSANRVTASQADTLGGAAGSESVTLTINQIPAHTHTVTYLGSKQSLNAGEVNYATREYNSGTFASGSTGGGQSHPNVPPYISLNYIIKL